MKTPLIKIENLEKEFGDGEAKVQVLHGVNLEIYSGEYIIFFGPSGCGKSTLLNCIAGLEIPTRDGWWSVVRIYQSYLSRNLQNIETKRLE
jgi:putative ABC transport system ATP-binding protein